MNSMTLRALFNTHRDLGLTVARVALALVMIPHGLQKVFGWFGGSGFSITMLSFTDGMGIPAFFAFLNIFTESFGAILLGLGLLTRVAALATGINMLVAAYLVHLPNGFFMNWGGQQAGEGFEFHLLAIGLAAASVISGGGSYSLDAVIAKRYPPSSMKGQEPKPRLREVA